LAPTVLGGNFPNLGGKAEENISNRTERCAKRCTLTLYGDLQERVACGQEKERASSNGQRERPTEMLQAYPTRGGSWKRKKNYRHCKERKGVFAEVSLNRKTRQVKTGYYTDREGTVYKAWEEGKAHPGPQSGKIVKIFPARETRQGAEPPSTPCIPIKKSGLERGACERAGYRTRQNWRGMSPSNGSPG